MPCSYIDLKGLLRAPIWTISSAYYHKKLSYCKEILCLIDFMCYTGILTTPTEALHAAVEP